MPTASHGNLWDNPLGTDGFEFIEYAAPDPLAMGRLFEQMGFTAVARHRAKNVLLYRQGNVNFIVNAEPNSFAQSFARVHGPSICAIAFRVSDAAKAFEQCVRNGAWGVEAHPGPMELNIPAIKGIGDSLIYLVDRYPAADGTGVSIYDIDFVPLARRRPASSGCRTDLYRSPDAQRAPRPDGGMGRVLRAAVQLPRDPLLRHRRPADRSEEQGDDEPRRQDPHSDQRERGRQEPDPGIPDRLSRRRHPARRARHRRTSIRRSRRCAAKASTFQDSPDTYYEALATRLPGHREDTARLARNRILIDGAPATDEMLLQIFTATVIGPIFFEIIQRKGNEGFGEGNFRALFESIEQDQIRRGVLKA